MPGQAPKKIFSDKLPHAVWDVALSDSGHILLATGSNAMCVAGREKLALTTDDEVWSVALSPNGQRIAIGSNDRYAMLYERSGKKLWEFKTGEHVMGVAISTNGLAMAVASRDRACHLFSTFSNIPLWSYQGAQSFLRVAVNRDGTRVAAGGYGGDVYLFNEWGQVLWRDKGGRYGDIWGLAFDELNRYLVVASEKDERIYLYTLTGQLLWSKNLGQPVRGVAITCDGQYIAALMLNGTIVLYRQNGEKLWQYKLGYESCSIAMSSDGRYIVVGARTGHVVLLNNDAYISPIGRPNDLSAPWMVARIMRATYLENKHRAICAWFTMFDDALRRGYLGFCQALLTEVNQQDYPFTLDERRGVDSREGAYLLLSGFVLQYRGEVKLAQQFYKDSLRCYKQAGDLAGQGLADFLLEAGGPPGMQRPDAPLLGQGEAYLAMRLENIPLSDIPQRLAIIHAARACGWVETLRAAVMSEESFSDLHIRKEAPIIRATALAAFERMKPAVDVGLLLAALPDAHWVVRWRAAALIRARYQAFSAFERTVLRRAVDTAYRIEPIAEVKKELVAAMALL